MENTLYNATIFTQLNHKNICIESTIDSYEKINRRVPVQHIKNNHNLNCKILQSVVRRDHIVKITLDIFCGFLGCMLLIIFIPLVFLMNLFGNKGPLFYKQKRVGKNEEIFEIIKFRSMRVNSEERGAVWAKKK